MRESLIIYNNSKHCDEVYIRYNNFFVNYYIDENNSILYSKDGIVYYKKDDIRHTLSDANLLEMRGNKLRNPDW